MPSQSDHLGTERQLPAVKRLTFRGWISVFFVGLAVFLLGIPVTAPTLAYAQESGVRGWSLRWLVAPRKQERLEPQADIPRARTKKRTKKASKSRNNSTIARQRAEPEVPVVEKQPDAKVVLVVGDFLGGGLAEGLAAVYAENPRIRIVDKSNGSSGLVREDFYNWPQEIGPLIEAEKPAAVVVMLGSNDRQQLRVGDASEAPRTDKWTKEYDRRTKAFATAIRQHKVPLLWVGIPAFKSSKMTSDMLAFNEVYRTSAESVQGEFVDVWDGFVDENGSFVTVGPDINGQPVRLRSDDGINLTRAGKRKLAFYAEKPLNKMLGETTSPNAAATAPAALPALAPDGAGVPAPIDRTVPISLNDPELDGGTELLGARPSADIATRSPTDRLTIDGLAPEAAPGRADDFSWPRRTPSPATAAAPTTPETTATINR